MSEKLMCGFHIEIFAKRAGTSIVASRGLYTCARRCSDCLPPSQLPSFKHWQHMVSSTPDWCHFTDDFQTSCYATSKTTTKPPCHPLPPPPLSPSVLAQASSASSTFAYKICLLCPAILEEKEKKKQRERKGEKNKRSKGVHAAHQPSTIPYCSSWHCSDRVR